MTKIITIAGLKVTQQQSNHRKKIAVLTVLTFLALC